MPPAKENSSLLTKPLTMPEPVHGYRQEDVGSKGRKINEANSPFRDFAQKGINRDFTRQRLLYRSRCRKTLLNRSIMRKTAAS